MVVPGVRLEDVRVVHSHPQALAQCEKFLKGLQGVATHEHREWIPILENDQDMERLVGQVRGALTEYPASHAFLLLRHGMYTWGETLSEAVRHVEIVEFLLEAVARSERGGTTWP